MYIFSLRLSISKGSASIHRGVTVTNIKIYNSHNSMLILHEKVIWLRGRTYNETLMILAESKIFQKWTFCFRIRDSMKIEIADNQQP